METANSSKQQIALELTITAYEKDKPLNSDNSPEGEGKAIAALYNAILENLNLDY